MSAPRRARNILASYYGASVGAPSADEVDDMNIDGASFNADKYVGNLLQHKSLPELMQRGIAMVSEIKSLDSDMQMLVYENYNKFISATDTIRKMKNRVEEMESQMGTLEENMGSISAASDSVNSSLSDRRSQLEGLNGVKKNLTKLQFLMDLPSRLQGCVCAGEYDEAVEHHRRAQRILRAMGGNAGSFQGIREEAATIMRKLTETLTAKLQEPELEAEELGRTTRLMLLLDGEEPELLKEYLARRRRALQDYLKTFAPKDSRAEMEAIAWQDRPAGTPDEPSVREEGDAAAAPADEPSAAASYVAQLGSGFGPQLVALHADWQRLFMDVDVGEGEGGLGVEAKAAMLLEALNELSAAFLEQCRASLQDEGVTAAALVRGLGHALDALRELHEAVPQANLLQRATRLAEQIAKRAIDDRLQALQLRLTALASDLGSDAASGDAAAPTAPTDLNKQLASAAAAISAAVGDALEAAFPLLAPLAERLNLRGADMARHLVTRLQAALVDVARAAAEPEQAPVAVLLRAGLCSGLAAEGVAAVQVQLKRELTPAGLGGAALGFEVTPLQRQMQAASDELVHRFVEMQAQSFSLDVARALRATDWLHCSPPREVTDLVETVMGRLRSMQALASQVFPGENTRSLLPQGPFPASASQAMQMVEQRTRQQAAGGLGAQTIHKDMQRMFARKISFSVELGSGKGATIAKLMTHVTKLTLKTLVEELRLGTFGRAGFEQVQVDVAMLRWVLPACVDEEGDVLGLLDEAIISCQERCVELGAVEHSVLEGLCERKRQQLLLSLA